MLFSPRNPQCAHHVRDIRVGLMQQLLKFPRRLLVPMPRILKRLDLCRALVTPFGDLKSRL